MWVENAIVIPKIVSKHQIGMTVTGVEDLTVGRVSAAIIPGRSPGGGCGIVTSTSKTRLRVSAAGETLEIQPLNSTPGMASAVNFNSRPGLTFGAVRSGSPNVALTGDFWATTKSGRPGVITAPTSAILFST